MLIPDPPRTTYHHLLTPSEEALVARSFTVARDGLAPLADEVDRGGRFHPGSFALVRDAGLLGAMCPREAGGWGAGCLATAMSLEVLASACSSTAALVLFHHTVVRRILDVGSPEQKERLLPELCGRWLGASAWTEPGSGAAKKTLQTNAASVEGGYRLDGHKSYCTGAGIADVYTVLAGQERRSEPGAEPLFGRSDQSFFLVYRDNPGLSFGPPFDGLGLRGSESGELILSGAVVSTADRLGEEGEGARIMALNRHAALHPGILGLGIAAAALEEARRFARSHGTAQHQGVRFELAAMAADLDSARLQVYEGACLADRRHPEAARTALLAKVLAADAAQRVTGSAVQLLGKAGYARGSGVERLLRDARALSIMGPTSELCREMVGSHDAGLTDLSHA